MRFLMLSLVTILASLFWGCGERETNPVYPVIHNGIEKVVKKIDTSKSKIYGAGEQERVLANAGALEVDQIGNIYVLDGKQQMILKFDRDLNFLRNIGTTGEGPGEFYYPRAVTTDSHNYLYVPDLNGKISVFDDKGDYKETKKTDFPLLNMFINKVSGIATISHNDYIENEEKKHSFDNQRYICLSDLTIDTMIPVPFYRKAQFPFKNIQKDKDFVILPTFVLYTGDRDYLYVCSGDKYEITVYGKNREIIKKITKDYKPVPISAKAFNMAKESMRKFPHFESMFEKVGRFYPVMRSVAVDEEGRVLVEIYQTNEERRHNYRTQYDMFSKEGKYLKTIEFSEKILTPLVIRSNYIHFVSENQSGEILLKKVGVESME